MQRPRRLRRTPAIRRLVSEQRLHPADLILPMFVSEALSEPKELSGMPGVLQHTLESLVAAAREAVDAGVGGLMLFGIPAERDAVGSQADDPDGILNRALAAVVAEVGEETVVMADLCLDEFTDHGHCGVLDADGGVDNDATLERYASMALAQAEAGAHVLGLSGMMDGQVAVVREALDAAGRTDVIILAYAAKFASAFYGPFREAVDSQLSGDRRTYQQDPANGREAIGEVTLDLAEGADIVMVKPGLPYLDVLAETAQASPVPVWSYQVSGEYAMVEFAARAGAIDREPAILESLVAFKRAGADAILTYWAAEVAAQLTAGDGPRGMSAQSEPRWLDDDEQRAWRALIDGHQLLLGRLEADLRASHQMALVEYKLFVRLSEQPDRSMRMAHLADDIGVSRSRLTHIVARCEQRGYLERSSEADDRRGVNCRLTDRGFERLASAAPVHAGGVRDYLIDLLDDEEIATMERIFSKVLAEQQQLRGTGRGRSSRDES